MIRFRLNHDKCIQGIHWIAKHKPGVTQYYIGKIFFFADKQHVIDWGRPISGDRYVAVEHGPVPSTIYDLIKDTGGEPDEIADKLNERVDFVSRGNKRLVYVKNGEFDFPDLSETDKEYLEYSTCTYGTKTFTELKEISHKDPAFNAAWDLPGLNNEMDITLWYPDDEDGREAIRQLVESSWVIKSQRLLKKRIQTA